MKKSNVIDVTTELVLNEARKIYGLEGSMEILKNYCSYVQMKKENNIYIGSYNILIRNKSDYDSAEKFIQIIYRLLKKFNIVDTYRYLTRDEIRRTYQNDRKEAIKEDLLILDTIKMDYHINYIIQDVKWIMEKYENKVFIIVDKDENEGFINTRVGERLAWTMEIASISPENKVDYIEKKLKENSIDIEKNLDYINHLSQKPFWEVKKELINAIVVCKRNNKDIIAYNSIKEEKKEEVKDEILTLKELDSLIGITEIKKQVSQIINYLKISKTRGKMPMLHMCFLGNPGTGKTTVARIIGKIFSEMKLLSDKNKFVEAQRCDLIGEYVGQTAPKTERIIKRADGGVLFIDEAYSIASYIQDEAGRDYGAECLATLLKEMEDKRDSLCVIMAGYTKEMENMLKVNPGFESRIQFKINFPDYTENELYEIFKKMVKEEKYKLSNNIKPFLLEFFKKEKQKENFSNARFVRNLFEKIKFEQADRVVINKEDVNVIKKCDIENAIKKQTKKIEKRRQIGFANVG